MKKYLLIICLFALPAIGQSAYLTGIPDGTDIYTITLKPGQNIRGSDTATGALKTVSGFINDLDFPAGMEALPSNLTIVIDSPSEPGEETLFKKSILTVVRQDPHQQEARYKREGYVLETVGENERVYVQSTDVARQTRLVELQQKQAQQQQDNAPAETENTAEIDSPPPTGFLAPWGRHIATVLGAFVVFVGIWKYCF